MDDGFFSELCFVTKYKFIKKIGWIINGKQFKAIFND